MPALTDPRWERACQLRADGGDVRASYHEAGFTGKPSVATKFFKRPPIISRISEIVAQRHANERKANEIATKKVAVDKEWVLHRLMYNAEQSLRGRPIKDRQGNPIPGQFTQPNESAANRALELIGNHLGMFIQRHEIGAPGDFARLSDDELNDALAEQAKALGLPDEAIAGLLTYKGDAEAVE